MSFEQISYLAQIVASIGVVVSLIFVGLQIFPKGTFEATAGTLLGELLRTPRGATRGAAPNISALFPDSSRTSMPCSPRPDHNPVRHEGDREKIIVQIKRGGPAVPAYPNWAIHARRSSPLRRTTDRAVM